MSLLVLTASFGLLAPSAADLSTVLSKLREPRTLKARFLQEKESPAFSTSRVVEGRIVFVRPRKLLWATDRPFVTRLVVDGDRVTMRMSKLGRTQQFDLTAHPDMKAVFDTLLFFAEADPRQLEGRFRVRLGSSGRQLILSPTGEGAKELITEVRVGLSPSGSYLESVELLQSNGSKTTWRFVDVEVDAPVEASVFGG